MIQAWPSLSALLLSLFLLPQPFSTTEDPNPSQDLLWFKLYASRLTCVVRDLSRARPHSPRNVDVIWLAEAQAC